MSNECLKQAQRAALARWKLAYEAYVHYGASEYGRLYEAARVGHLLYQALTKRTAAPLNTYMHYGVDARNGI